MIGNVSKLQWSTRGRRGLTSIGMGSKHARHSKVSLTREEKEALIKFGSQIELKGNFSPWVL